MSEQTLQSLPSDKLWDEIPKAIVYIMPNQLLLLIKEVYGKVYPPDTPIRLLSTEHSIYLSQEESPPSSNLADISFLAADTDYYNIECQMKNDKLIIRFPHSVVLYPDKNRNLPAKLRCRVIFHDNSEHIYQTPAVRIHS